MARPKLEGTRERQREYTERYQKENVRKYALKINRKTEPEIEEWLDSHKPVQTYLKGLIKADMEKER